MEEKKKLEKKENTPLTKEEKLRKEISAFMLGTDLLKKLDKYQVNLCLKTALAWGLNPLKREIHFVPFYNAQASKFDVSIVVGYEVYLKRAARSGLLKGWSVKIDGDPQKPDTLVATVTIKRKDWDEPFVFIQWFSEVKQTKKDGGLMGLWATKPITMLRKTAISQAFRLCFPEELAGMPYIQEEIGIPQSSSDLGLPVPEVVQEKREEKVTPIKKTMETLEEKLAKAKRELEKKNETPPVEEKVKILTEEEKNEK